LERKNNLIIDTGFFVALFSRKDKHHKKALACQSQVKNRTWITTWPVLTETGHLLGGEYSKQFLALLSLIENGNILVFDFALHHLPNVRKLMVKYNQLPMDLADASLVILAEELGSGDILSTDQRDFGTYRFKNHSPFRNLLFLN
jgi:predicted nucleic acid-binding protein